jgi:glycosyltransferase involved in cell wall biosynthesis
VDVLVVTEGKADADPRTVNVLHSIRQMASSIELVELQTMRPSLRKVWMHGFTSNIETSHASDLSCSRTWAPRSQAVSAIVRTLNELFGEHIGNQFLLIMKTGNPDEAYYLNKCAVAFLGLQKLLETWTESSKEFVIVTEDFPSALAASVLLHSTDVSHCYDAHELFLESLELLHEDLSEIFTDLIALFEKFVWATSSLVATVSPGLAQYISKHADDRAVFSVPNYVPLGIQRPTIPDSPSSPTKLRCCYFGGAAPHRNVDVLVSNWPKDSGMPSLDLYVPSSKFAKNIRNLANDNCNVTVHNAVPHEEMIPNMENFDIGIIPYNYPYPYSHSSPNKLGEYIAAGIGVVAHPQDFTSVSILKHGLGAVCDFTIPEAISNTLEVASNGLTVADWKRNSKRSFVNDLNWERGSVLFFKEMQELIEMQFSSTYSSEAAQSFGLLSRVVMTVECLLEVCRPFLIKTYSQIRDTGLDRLISKKLLRRIS